GVSQGSDVGQRPFEQNEIPLKKGAESRDYAHPKSKSGDTRCGFYLVMAAPVRAIWIIAVPSGSTSPRQAWIRPAMTSRPPLRVLPLLRFFAYVRDIPGATIGPDGLHRVFLHPR